MAAWGTSSDNVVSKAEHDSEVAELKAELQALGE